MAATVTVLLAVPMTLPLVGFFTVTETVLGPLEAYLWVALWQFVNGPGSQV